MLIKVLVRSWGARAGSGFTGSSSRLQQHLDKVAGCMVHSDRGSQFRSRDYREALATHRMVGSMGRVASCGGNVVMESFFALLQKNVLDRWVWSTWEQLRVAIVCWIERTYHCWRRQVRLGRLTPVEYETMMSVTAAYAA